MMQRYPFFLQGTNSTKTASKAMCCRCGTNKKSCESSHSSCTDNPIYRSRCKCLKHKQPCTSLFQCSGCNNPHGQRPSKSSLKTASTHKCRKHEFQVKIPKSQIFAELKGETIAKRKWKHSFCMRYILSLLPGTFRRSQSSTRTYMITPHLPIVICN